MRIKQVVVTDINDEQIVADDINISAVEAPVPGGMGKFIIVEHPGRKPIWIAFSKVDEVIAAIQTERDKANYA